MIDFKELPKNQDTSEPKIKDFKEIKSDGEIKEMSEKDYKSVLIEQRTLIDSVNLESLREMNNQLIKDTLENRNGLSEDEKKRVKEAHPDWPDSIIDAISSWKEYEIYHNAGVKYEKINGKDCLIRTDIDMDQKDEYGRTNKERMEQGLSPLDKDGNPIELHHIGQKADSPLAELTKSEHRGKGNDAVLHNKNQNTEIDRNVFREEKETHWEKRAQVK